MAKGKRKKTKKEVKFATLPNPEIKRKFCTEDCDGCDHQFFLDGIGETVCVSYVDPAAIQRRGCALQSNKVVDSKEEKKVNPIKLSKLLAKR